MHTKLQEIIDRIEDDRAALQSCAAHLSQTQLDFQVSLQTWSVGEVLDHLRLVEIGIVTLLQKSGERAAQAGFNQPPVDGSVLDCLDQFPIETTNVKRQAPAFITPAHGKAKDELLRGLQTSRENLTGAIDKIKDYDLHLLDFPHPFLGKLDLYQWILFVGKHERRHLKQAENVTRDPNFPAS